MAICKQCIYYRTHAGPGWFLERYCVASNKFNYVTGQYEPQFDSCYTKNSDGNCKDFSGIPEGTPFWRRFFQLYKTKELGGEKGSTGEKATCGCLLDVGSIPAASTKI